MKICYYVINPSIPVLFTGFIAFGKLMSGQTQIDVAFPISIGFSVYPLGSVVALFQVPFQGIPWFYVDLWPAQPNMRWPDL